MDHCNTISHQMLKFIPRHQFEALESHHSTGRRSRTFSRWNQFAHLMFMQLTGRASLRDVIDLSLGAFPWASFRRTKSAIKVHTLLDHSGYLPAFAAITDGKTHESKMARTIHFPKGSIVAEDRAYTDYKWFA